MWYIGKFFEVSRWEAKMLKINNKGRKKKKMWGFAGKSKQIYEVSFQSSSSPYTLPRQYFYFFVDHFIGQKFSVKSYFNLWDDARC